MTRREDPRRHLIRLAATIRAELSQPERVVAEVNLTFLAFLDAEGLASN